jgi:hypothetical protein
MMADPACGSSSGVLAWRRVTAIVSLGPIRPTAVRGIHWSASCCVLALALCAVRGFWMDMVEGQADQAVSHVLVRAVRCGGLVRCRGHELVLPDPSPMASSYSVW